MYIIHKLRRTDTKLLRCNLSERQQGHCVSHYKLWALSIQQKFRFEISEIPRAQCNGTFWLRRPNPSHCAFGYCSCNQNTEERYWGKQFCQMERDILVQPTEMSRLVKVNHLQKYRCRTTS